MVSKFRNAAKFELVPRSVQDPAQHDPSAPPALLQPTTQTLKHSSVQTLADLQALGLHSRPNEGEAAQHGIFFDDSEYDYMQHLKPISTADDLELIARAPKPARMSLQRAQEAVLNVPLDLVGLQPGMDPALRQVLEALDEEAFVQDDGEDMFADLIVDGELGEDEKLPDWENLPTSTEDDAALSLTQRLARFKAAAEPDSDGESEGGDTLCSMFSLGGSRTMRKMRKAGTASSSYSMSSSSMFRNEHLTALDEKLDILEEEYDRESDSEASSAENMLDQDGIEDIMDEFLGEYEVVAGHYRPTVSGSTPFEKADNLRASAGAAHISQKIRDKADGLLEESDYESPPEEEKAGDRWDCETILTTYTNIENHPRMISARAAAMKSATSNVQKIAVSSKTGMPIRPIVEEEELSDSESDKAPVRETVIRPRGESAEAKKARKEQSKAEKQARRDQKRESKQTYALEKKRQVGISNRKVASSDIATRGGGKQISIL